MVRGDSLNYAHTAFEHSIGTENLGDWTGVPRIGMYYPVSFLYSVFGPSQITTLIFPLLSSLASIVFIYLITRMFAKEIGGLIAAFLWAFLPLDVFLATSLLPDVPVATFSTGAIYFLLKGLKAKNRSVGPFLAAGALILFAISVKPIAIISLVAVIGLIIQDRWKHIVKKWGRLIRHLPDKWQVYGAYGTGILAIAGLAYYGSIQPYAFLVTMAKSGSDLSSFFVDGFAELDVSGRRLTFSPLFIFSAPLFIISALWTVYQPDKRLRRILLWLAIVFIYYEWGTINLDPSFFVPLQPFNEARNLLFVLAPIVVIAALYIENFFQGQRPLAIISGIAALALAAAWNIRGLGINDLGPVWLRGAGLLLLIISIWSLPLAKETKRKRGIVLGSILLLSFAIANLKPVQPYHSSWYADRAERLEMLAEAAVLLIDGSDTPILIDSRGNAMSLNYVSNFELGFDWLRNNSRSGDYRIIHSEENIKGPYLQLEFDDFKGLEGNEQHVAVITGEQGRQLYITLRDSGK